jgi:hypothetical protein
MGAIHIDRGRGHSRTFGVAVHVFPRSRRPQTTGDTEVAVVARAVTSSSSPSSSSSRCGVQMREMVKTTVCVAMRAM